MKDKMFLGSELFIGVTKYLPQMSDSINFLNYRNGAFELDEEMLRDYVRALKNAGVNSFRSLLPYFEPVDYYDYEGTGILLDKELFLPFEYSGGGEWDLSLLNDNYFDILTEILNIIIDGNESHFVLPIIDNCIEQAGIGAFRNNKQGVEGIYDPKAREYIYKLIDEYLYRFAHYPDGFIIWELGNEIRNDKLAFDIFNYLIDKGIKPEHITLGINANIGTAGIENPDGLKKLRNKIRRKYGVKLLRKTIWSAHGHLKRDDPSGFGKLTNWIMKPENWMSYKNGEQRNDIRIMFSTDGTGDGLSKCDIHPRPSAKYRRRPSYKQWEKWLKAIFEKYVIAGKNGLPLIYAEQFIKVQSVECQVPFWNEMSELYKKYTGEYPANYGKFPAIVEPEPEPEPEPIPDEEEDNMGFWDKVINWLNGKKKIKRYFLFLILLVGLIFGAILF